jgi:O-methyltransferase involved in polyketide biosynthesis
MARRRHGVADQEKTSIQLAGVPETLLWTLYNRASEARRADGLLRDPLAVKIADAIDYPFASHFGRPGEGHVLRALRFDEQVRRFLEEHPDGTVVALADGLETQAWRVDNGRMRWLSVDLPEAIDVRRRFLTETDRFRDLPCSALDFRWMDEVDASRGVMITAQGLLMYLAPADVARLIAGCAERFPGGSMLFDVIPRWASRMMGRGFQKTKAYRLPPMPWGLNADELATLRSFHPNIVRVREVDIGRGRGFVFRYAVRFLSWIPILCNKRPSFVLLDFGPGGQPRSNTEDTELRGILK